MNYYERHLGDYAKNTGHLSILEHGVYTLLIDRYYTKEQPIPVSQVYRVTRAKAKEEREAVDAVLEEFFTLRDDNWHNERCDEVIAEYQAGEPERETKKKNENARVQRYRDERQRMFSDLHKVGEFPNWNLPMPELRALYSRFCNAPATQVDTRNSSGPVTAPVTPVTHGFTATQFPLPNSHSPSPSTQPLTPEGRSLNATGRDGGGNGIGIERAGKGRGETDVLTTDKREARDLEALKNRRVSVDGLREFRDPNPGETAQQYRNAQDAAFTEAADRRIRGGAKGLS